MSRVATKLKKATITASGVFTARYIRLTGFEKSASVIMISQFALYTDENLTNLIIGQDSNSNPTIPELTGNVTPHNSFPPNKAGAAYIGAAWYLMGRTTQQLTNDWIQYDMGSPITIGSILVRNGFSSSSSNYWATGFNVEHSNDGTNWTLIQAVTNTTGATVNTINT
jgi:hypothetical protein